MKFSTTHTQVPCAQANGAPPHYIVFAGNRCLASGALPDTLTALRDLAASKDSSDEPVLVFDNLAGKPVDLDLRADDSASQPPASSEASVNSSPAARGPGRPRLGVQAREVTLLPRHWDWLGHQPGGASVALRRLVEDARRSHAGRDKVRRAQECAYGFISAIAGQFAHFEEAARALFAGDETRFDALTDSWPEDIRRHARALAAPAFESPSKPADMPGASQ